MRRHAKASSAGSISGRVGGRSAGRRTSLAFLGALVLAITVCLGAASAIADTPPSVTIDAPTEVSYINARVSGTVDPEGGPSATTWVFETSTDPSDPSKWEPQGSASGEISGAEAEASDPVAVGGYINLAQGTEYSVRLVAENEESANRSVTGPPHPSFTTPTSSPPAVTIDAPTEVTGTTARFSGTVNPEGTDFLNTTLWYFECTPECPNVGGEEISPGTAAVPVSRTAKGLEPATTYEVRLIAGNYLGEQGEAGPETFTTPPEAPYAATIGATVAAGGTSATVGGKVNPRRLASTYWIEYGTSDAYGQNAPSTKDAAAGSGGEMVVVSQALSGLAPETTYHYRVVANNATGTTVGQDLTFETPPASSPPAESCPNQALRVGLSAALPDCRAYEQISPQNKQGSNASPKAFAADGEHVQFFGTGAFAGAPRGGSNNYVGTRTGDGWLTKPITPILPPSVPNSVIGPEINVNQDGSEALLSTIDPLDPADTNNRVDFYRSRADGSFEWLSKPTATFPPISDPAWGNVWFGRKTDDLSHVVFIKSAKLVPAAAGLEDIYAYGLYEWANGTLRLVSVDTQGELLNPYGAGIGSGPAGGEHLYTHALSDDGERIFFTTPASIQPALPPYDIKRVYLRESAQTTTEISASQCTEVVCEGPVRDALYQGAAADGSVAFFRSEAQLTNDATPGGGLYRYEVDSGELTLLVPGAIGLVGNSDDGSMVYFGSTAKLAPGGSPGADNLYLFDAGTGTTTFIATLGPDDAPIWVDNDYNAAAVTPSGNNLVFRTTVPLAAGYDNAGHSEIYRYDAPSAELSCVSCLPAGSPAQADASFSNGQSYQENMSADGSYVVFQSSAPLLPQDTNGKTDVYQWHDGTVSLISSGTSPNHSAVAGINPSGRDVIFSTWERLTPSDTDGQIDAYTARINGGFDESPTPPPTPCSGEGCRGSATGPAAGSSPGSANFDGAEGGSPDRSGAIAVKAVSKGQAKQWAKTGLLSLRVKVPAAGRVKATASARLGKKSATVASAATSAKKAGTVSLALRLSKAARSYLEQRGRLPVTIAVTHSKSKAAKRLQVTLVAQQSKQANSRGQR